MKFITGSIAMLALTLGVWTIDQRESGASGQDGVAQTPPPNAGPFQRGRGPGRGGPGRGGRPGFPGPGAMPVPASNPLTPEKVALGRQLFFDTRLSADGTRSCGSCHNPDLAFADGRPIARGIHETPGDRNTPTIVNAGFLRSLFWDGRAGTLEQQALGPIFSPKEMGLSPELLQHRVKLTPDEVAAAIASYVRTIRSRDSRYDWYVAGQPLMLTELERAGLEIFRGSGRCATCHSGPNFTDDRFHDTGIGWQNGRFADDGRFNVSHDERDRGAFKTPTLREVARTAPYMHDGSLSTLEDVVDFYSRGGNSNPALDFRMQPGQFSLAERAALVAFLKALSGKITEGL